MSKILRIVRGGANGVSDRRDKDRRKGAASTSFSYNKDHVIRVGALTVDVNTLTVKIHGRTIEITPKEFQIIDLLIKNAGRAVNAEEIIAVIWQGSVRATKADVQQYIYMLRRKLEQNPQRPEILKTVRSCGYKLDL